MTDILPSAPGPHPTPEELLRARRQPNEGAAEKILAHAALCASCAEEEYRIEAFESAEPATRWDLHAALRRFTGAAPQRTLAWRPLALAASLLLAAGVLLVVHRSAPEDVVRGSAPSTVLESPVGDIEQPPADFRFTLTGPVRVRVRVFDAERAYEWTSEPSTIGRVDFPPEEQRKLVPGVEYRWTLLGAGDVAAGSFRIRR